jgi:hypothetical protein
VRSLLDLAQERRQLAQLERCVPDGRRDPEAIVGPARCARCGELLAPAGNRSERDRVGPVCRVCWLKRGAKLRRCLVFGCKRKARSNGRCRLHRDGDPDYLLRWGTEVVGPVPFGP